VIVYLCEVTVSVSVSCRHAMALPPQLWYCSVLLVTGRLYTETGAHIILSFSEEHWFVIRRDFNLDGDRFNDGRTWLMQLCNRLRLVASTVYRHVKIGKEKCMRTVGLSPEAIGRGSRPEIQGQEWGWSSWGGRLQASLSTN